MIEYKFGPADIVSEESLLSICTVQAKLVHFIDLNFFIIKF